MLLEQKDEQNPCSCSLCLLPLPWALGLRGALVALQVLLVGFSWWYQLTLSEQKPLKASTSHPQALHKP